MPLSLQINFTKVTQTHPNFLDLFKVSIKVQQSHFRTQSYKYTFSKMYKTPLITYIENPTYNGLNLFKLSRSHQSVL